MKKFRLPLGGLKVSSHDLKIFWGDMSFIRKRGYLTPKINITFFIINLILNIFIVNNFFGESVFSEEKAI